ncbi:MAG: nitroreductase family protein [Acidimicrobiales bacterium]
MLTWPTATFSSASVGRCRKTLPSSPDQAGPRNSPSFDEVVRARRMTRAFTDLPVADDSLDRILAHGQRGPSAGNTRSLELLVLLGERVGRYWEVTLPASRRPEFPWPGLLRAPVLVVPYVSPARYVDRYAEHDKVDSGLGESEAMWSVPYWWVDGGAAVQNMLLAAVAEGLGVCLFGQFDHEAAVRDVFGVPEGQRAVGTVALGHADDNADRLSRSASRPRRGLDETVHRNRW